MPGWLIWTLGGLAALGGLLVLAVGGGYLWLRGSIPQIEGQITVAGLEAPVEVRRDSDGLVTIRAENDHDATLALGYVHAQDRLAQMDFMRRMGAGRLSELLGESTVDLDRMMRTLGLYRLVEENFERLSRDARQAAEAYTEGVNAFLAEPGGPLPVEFQVLGYTPEPWRPADSLMWGRLMALQLSNNWSDEALRLRLSKHLTPEQIAFLWPRYPDDAPVALGDLAAVQDLDAELPGRILPWAWAPKDASNSWVISGALTASGKPILANDLHLALTTPGQWYLVRIETPGHVLAGATAPGVPFLIAGHNGHIAWAITTTHSDNQDLFVERISKDVPGSYETPEGPWSFQFREETVQIRDEDPLRFAVRSTRHGPVVSGLRSQLAKALPEGHALALSWPALRSDDLTGDAIYKLNRARDWPAFLDAMRNFHSPQQNILYADRQGTIGFIAPGRLPIRPSGDGRFPVDGWTGSHDWRGEIPFEALPQTVDPPSGRIIVANNKIVPDDFPHLIAADWPSPNRARRIEQLLNGADNYDTAQQMAWQQDVLSLGAESLLPLLLDTPAASERAQRAIEMLSAWDRRMERDRPEPLIYHAWLRAANRALLADELGPEFAAFQRADTDLLGAILTEGESWCDDIETDLREDCDGQLAKAIEAALDELEDRFGRDMNAWRWGAAHLVRLQHPVLGRVPLIGALFTRSVETGGGSDTLNRGAARLGGSGPGVFENRHGPTFRAIYDLADLDSSLFMITGGQSGNPLSPFYGSLVEAWRDGLYLKLDGQQTEAAHRLLLLPE